MSEILEKIEEIYEKIYEENKYKIPDKNKFISLYEKINDEKLKNIFSLFHHLINQNLDLLNSRVFSNNPDNNYFWADSSRELINLIHDINELEEASKNTNLSFHIDETYKKALEQLKTILKPYHGSQLPKDLKETKIIRTKAIFILDDTTLVFTDNSKTRYNLKLIGEGSYAKVFKYKDLNYNKFFCIKRLLSDSTEKEKERFIHEFEVMKNMKHPFITEVFKFDAENNEYSMEFMDMSLRKYIEKNNDKLSLKERKSIAYKIILAIEFINSKNYLHRDLSPNNILIKEYESIIFPKISDFGLVKKPNSDLTSKGTEFKGSYNDPQLMNCGFDAYSLTHEIYSLTKVIYFVLTGKDASKNDNYAASFFAKGTNIDINKRFKDFNEIKEALKKIEKSL